MMKIQTAGIDARGCPGSRMLSLMSTPSPPLPPPQPPRETDQPPRESHLNHLPVCPVCGGALAEIGKKWRCQRCHTIVETCCEGSRG
uniref:Uncharacterized protein n=1 Tax=Schlesneria paludicola TaxID=360056 RepID=A0A7C2PBB3_9PLAN